MEESWRKGIVLERAWNGARGYRTMGSSRVPPVGRCLSDLQSYRGWQKPNVSLPQPHGSQFWVFHVENACRNCVPCQGVIPEGLWGGVGAVPAPRKSQPDGFG